MVEENFVVINHGVGDESLSVNDVENDVPEGALAVSFIRVPDFGKVIIWDGIYELILMNSLHGDGFAICFFHVCVWHQGQLNRKHWFHIRWQVMVWDQLR